MSVVTEDYDTFITILLSVISESSDLDDLLPDLELCLTSLIGSGTLPGSAATQISDFLSKLNLSIIKPLVSTGKLNPSLINLILKLTSAGFQRQNFQMVESGAYLLSIVPIPIPIFPFSQISADSL
jgi:hypothetical protein